MVSFDALLPAAVKEAVANVEISKEKETTQTQFSPSLIWNKQITEMLHQCVVIRHIDAYILAGAKAGERSILQHVQKFCLQQRVTRCSRP